MPNGCLAFVDGRFDMSGNHYSLGPSLYDATFAGDVWSMILTLMTAVVLQLCEPLQVATEYKFCASS